MTLGTGAERRRRGTGAGCPCCGAAEGVRVWRGGGAGCPLTPEPGGGRPSRCDPPPPRPPVSRARYGCRCPAPLGCAAPPCASLPGDALGCRDVVPDFERSPAASEVLSGGGDWLGERSGFLWLCPFLLSTPFLYVILPAGARRPVRLAWSWF